MNQKTHKSVYTGGGYYKMLDNLRCVDKQIENWDKVDAGRNTCVYRDLFFFIDAVQSF